jgi:hypothetical protein
LGGLVYGLVAAFRFSAEPLLHELPIEFQAVSQRSMMTLQSAPIARLPALWKLA